MKKEHIKDATYQKSKVIFKNKATENHHSKLDLHKRSVHSN